MSEMQTLLKKVDGIIYEMDKIFSGELKSDYFRGYVNGILRVRDLIKQMQLNEEQSQ